MRRNGISSAAENFASAPASRPAQLGEVSNQASSASIASGRTGDRAVDAFGREDEGAANAAAAAERGQLRLQRFGVGQCDELIERQHLEAIQAFGQVRGGFSGLGHCGGCIIHLRYRANPRSGDRQ